MYRAVTNPSTKVAYVGVSSVHDLYQSTYLADNRIDSGKGGVLATSDRGATWTPVGNLAKPVVCVALDPGNPGSLYAALVDSKEGGIYSVDTASPVPVWKLLSSPPRTEGHPYDIHPLRDGSLLCVFSGPRMGNTFTPSSGVFLSGDGGKTWEDRTDSRAVLVQTSRDRPHRQDAKYLVRWRFLRVGSGSQERQERAQPDHGSGPALDAPGGFVFGT